MSISFRKLTEPARLLDPRQDFEETQILTETRIDPLTGNTGRICHFAKLRFRRPDLEEIVRDSRARICPFCPDQLEKVTPRFTPDIVPEGKIKLGEAVVIPNFVPYNAYSAVTVISYKHYVPLPEFSKEMLVNAFQSSLQYIRAIQQYENNKEMHGLVMWNNFPPSGSTQIHPHLQIMVSDTPVNAQMSLIDKSKAFYQATGQNYWSLLVKKEETLGERYLGTIGNTVWLVPFLPTGMVGDILAIFKERPCMLDLEEKDLAAFATGLKKVLGYFDAQNYYSFNLAFYPGPRSQEYMWTQVKITPRINVQPILHTPDINAINFMYGEFFGMIYPEVLCQGLRGYFHTD